MSARYTTSILVVVSLIVAAPLRAQDASAPHDAANIPANAGAFAPRDLERNPSMTAFGAPARAADAESSAALFENAWDFTRPDSIPGFGSLPFGYDSRAVMPQISGNR